MPQSETIAAGPAWADELAARLEEQRGRLRGAVEAQRLKAREWETSLQAQLATIEQGLQEVAGDAEQSSSTAAARLAELKSEEKRLTSLDTDIASHRESLESLRQTLESNHQSHLAREQALLDEVTHSLAQLHTREAELAKDQAKAAAKLAEADTLRRGCDEAERLLLQHEEALKHREGEVARHGANLQKRDEGLAQREAILRERETVLQQRETVLRERDAAVGEQETAFRQRETALAERDDALRQRTDALREQDRHALEQMAQLGRREEKLKLDEQRMQHQRVSIAHELRARRKELFADAERQRAEAMQLAAGDESALGAQLAAAKVEVARLKASEDKQVHDHLVLEGKYEQAKRELLEQQEQLTLARETGGGEAISSADADDARKRLEMALADVRDLKMRNADLSDQVAKGRAAAGPAVVVTGDAMDWESRKQAMLAQLESDYDPADPQQRANKLTVEQAIQRTQEVVDLKDEEILELQQLLSEQSGNIGGVAIGAAAIAEMLDSDELVKQERESLRDLQEKLREQLKQAEIDLSVERAKIGRERALLEEKTRQYEEQKQCSPGSQDDPANKNKTGSNRGRWLQRLGLRDDEPK